MGVTRKYGGTGLGLNIVQQLVHSHNGTVKCDSAEGVGTTTTIRLPFLQDGSRPSIESKVRRWAHSFFLVLGVAHTVLPAFLLLLRFFVFCWREPKCS
jgi:hypothetical protein